MISPTLSLQHIDFQKLLEEVERNMSNQWGATPIQVGREPSEKPINKQAISTSFCQWSVYPNDMFMPSGPRKETLDAGVYKVVSTESGIAFVRMKVVTDDLIELDDAASQRVLSSMRQFWSSKDEYTRRRIIYKRGILLEGPAGSGKSSLVNLLTKTLIAADGIVLMCGHPGLMAEALAALRRIEPDRNIIVIFEDVDELIESSGEHQLLALLDGEHQIHNVVNVATTNFPEKLGARICNRPSRFDERILIGMPTAKAREKYLRHITREESITSEEIQKWVDDTDSFSVAHLRELAVAIFCLKQPYDDVLDRLKKMQTRPQPIKEFKTALGGFQRALEVVETLED
jgi:energy-coupling factor transporter ATP-binding protein EcfA2